MTGSAAERDDPLLTLRVHESTMRVLSILLRTLAELSDRGIGSPIRHADELLFSHVLLR